MFASGVFRLEEEKGSDKFRRKKNELIENEKKNFQIAEEKGKTFRLLLKIL